MKTKNENREFGDYLMEHFHLSNKNKINQKKTFFECKSLLKLDFSEGVKIP